MCTPSVGEPDRIRADGWPGNAKRRGRCFALLCFACLRFALPTSDGDMFNGLIDLIRMEAILYTTDDGANFEYGEIPADMKEDADKWRLHLLEEVASYDEHLM